MSAILRVRLPDGTVADIPAIKGDTPVKGVDYWTEEDKAEIKNYIDETKEVFIVHGNIGADGTVTLDKTYAEVKAAIDSGKHVEIKGTADFRYGWEYTAYLLSEKEDCFVFRISGTEWFEIYWYSSETFSVFMDSYVSESRIEDLEERIDELEATVGDCETALDNIIAIQNELMGVSK